jgi:hypothetical protein
VAEANAIGTTYLRAQLIAEPARSRSLELLRRYTTLAVAITHERSLNNRVPGAVLGLEVIGAAIALALLALHISILGRGLVAMLGAAALVTLLLLVTFDLDRPTRGRIEIPAAPLESLRASMALPPASSGR